MSEQVVLSPDQVKAILDNAPVAVFVSRVNDHGLLYANHRAREIFALSGRSDVDCHCIAGLEGECPFGQVGQMSGDEFAVREFSSPHSSRVYQLSGKLIDWAGESAYIEYIMDITDKKQEEEQHRKIEEELQTSFGNLPCGLCVYRLEGKKILPIFHNPVFFEITGYSEEHKYSVGQETIYLGVHPDDLERLRAKLEAVITNGGMMRDTYRLYNDHRKEYLWIHLEGAVRTAPDGEQFLYGVYTDVSEQVRLEQEVAKAGETMRETQQELSYLINSIPGGIASYQLEGGQFIPVFMSDGVPALTGHTRAEYEENIRRGILDNIYEPDRSRILKEGRAAVENGEVLELSYRIRRKDGIIAWIHLSGRRMGDVPDSIRFYAVFTSMPMELNTIANETADGIYAIDKENYELLYTNEAKALSGCGAAGIGKLCYAALHGLDAPCDFCTLKSFGADGQEHEMLIGGSDLVYSSRVKETVWNGIPAYVQYIRDVTEEVKARQEKERLELYCQTLIQNLPGGISVIRIEADGSMTPEYISDGFAALTKMTVKEADRLYSENVFAGIHPDDVECNQTKMLEFLDSGREHCEFKARFLRGDGSYIWVRDSVSIQEASNGIRRMYCIYTDISSTVEESERLHQQYEDLLLQHYHAPNPDELILGHCNVTKNMIIEIKDFTGSDLLERLGRNQEQFFIGMASSIVDEEEKQAFLDSFLNAPMLAAFKQKNKEQIQKCFLKFPGQKNGCYVQIKMSLVETPDTGDVTGILTVTDITDQTMSDRILNQMSSVIHDYIADVNLIEDNFRILSSRSNAHLVPDSIGCYSKRVAYMAEAIVVPKDRELYSKALDPEEICRRLQEESSYIATYSVIDEEGDIRTKNMTFFPIDLRIGRVCLVCTDITDSVRALENALAFAREADRAKSDFLSSMSHDIRTPMNAIMGMTTLALAFPDDRERVDNCLHKIDLANRHLLSLVNDVLDMSRIERSKVVMNLRELSISDLVQAVCAIIEPQAKSAGLQFFVKKKDSCGEYFQGDSLRINQILINLLSNAVKFTPEGGRVDFLIEGIVPLEEEKHIRYRFTIRDTGIGMPEDLLKHIFEPFVRAATAMRIEGTGLGLSITKGLVEQMNGKITVDSHPGKGTVFQVELEFEAAVNAERACKKAKVGNSGCRSERPFTGRTFLIAEDHPINSELLSTLLEMDGADSVVTTDGVQAVREFESTAQGTYDAILMDIQMPNMTGYEATRAIRKLNRPDAGTIPIVAMTANAFSEDVQASLNAGMNAHVAKPIDVEVLRDTLGKVLNDI